MQQNPTARLTEAIEEQSRLLAELIDIQRSHDSVLFMNVQIETVGESLQGPDIPLPNGVDLSVRLRPFAGATVTGYVSTRDRQAGETLRRKEMVEGESLEFKVKNPNALYFAADTAAVVFELMAEIDLNHG
jgi:hypothetical protein